jgi:hypothetical protein
LRAIDPAGHAVPPLRYRNSVTLIREFFGKYWSRWCEDKENHLKLRESVSRCGFLHGAKWLHPCHRNRVCPFCLFYDSVLPLYQEINTWSKEHKKRGDSTAIFSLSVESLISVTLEDYQNQLPSFLLLKKDIQNSHRVRALDKRWWRISLVDDGPSQTRIQLHLLFLSKEEQGLKCLDGIEERFPITAYPFTTRKQYHRLSQKTTITHLGRFYSYPYWLLTSPMDTVAQWMNSEIYYNRRVKR